jgi:hypothetical protein
MADWTNTPPPPPPGPIDPPAPDQIRPTDEGWNRWCTRELNYCPLPWTPACRIGIEVEDTGEDVEVAIDGSRPDDSGNGAGGWKKDSRKITIRQPPPYRDFRRWRRRYASLRTQRFRRYRARVIVECGDQKWVGYHENFWKPLGQPVDTGPRDTYYWVKSSGLIQKDGADQEWEDDEKRPLWVFPEPIDEHLGPNDTPPDYLVNPPALPPEFKLRFKFTLTPQLRSTFEEMEPPSPPKPRLWSRIEELPRGH